jgi:copper(I)-binding protein
MSMKLLVAGLALLLSACGGSTAGLTVQDAIYRAPLTDGSVGVAYFSITSSTADRITGVSSPQAERIEMHNTVTKDGLASMERADFVELPAGQTVTFAARGLHLMVFSPQAVAPDATFPIQIELESGHSETISFGQALVDGGK